MSRSQPEQEKKSLDSFVWVNEITGEVTFPPGEESTPAASGEKRLARSGSPHGRTPLTADAYSQASPANPKAAGKGPGARNPLLPDPFSLGGALPAQCHLGVSPPRASQSPPWALPCKLRNILTGNNRFSF
ncbi:uncharacterized protein C3orf86-like [Acomys russatus]|uniref:uncharacterized protein C3orf86-like n=1 Tax=Acomys russatus TaxID=60746 RepID=UPI0021E2F7A2|nr:uncharacterized protein C3orf86-like [Acomys russatus]